jgi:hypothetical protein
MPLEKNNLVNATEADPETLLENDKSKDLKLIEDQSVEPAFHQEQVQKKAFPNKDKP